MEAESSPRMSSLWARVSPLAFSASMYFTGGRWGTYIILLVSAQIAVSKERRAWSKIGQSSKLRARNIGQRAGGKKQRA